jgi:hypothetical protein
MILEAEVTTARLRGEIERLMINHDDRNKLAHNAFVVGAVHREGKLGEVIGTVAMEEFHREKNT